MNSGKKEIIGVPRSMKSKRSKQTTKTQVGLGYSLETGKLCMEAISFVDRVHIGWIGGVDQLGMRGVLENTHRRVHHSGEWAG